MSGEGAEEVGFAAAEQVIEPVRLVVPQLGPS